MPFIHFLGIAISSCLCVLGTQNEIAHAHYASQVSHRKTDVLTTARTTLSMLVSDEMLTIETGLSLFLSIWSRLQTDCMDILKWLQKGKHHSVCWTYRINFKSVSDRVSASSPCRVLQWVHGFCHHYRDLKYVSLTSRTFHHPSLLIWTVPALFMGQ